MLTLPPTVRVFVSLLPTDNRSENMTLNVGDYGAIMDRIAALHIHTRHGEEAVADASIP